MTSRNLEDASYGKGYANKPNNYGNQDDLYTRDERNIRDNNDNHKPRYNPREKSSESRNYQYDNRDDKNYSKKNNNERKYKTNPGMIRNERRHDSSKYNYSKKNDERKYETYQGMIRNDMWEKSIQISQYNNIENKPFSRDIKQT